MFARLVVTPGHGRGVQHLLLLAPVAVATFVLAYLDGGYAATTRGVVSIAVWWAVALGISLSVLPFDRLTAGTIRLGVAFTAFVAWTLASVAWAWDPERAVDAFDLAALYLGLFLLGALAVNRRTIGEWVNGLTWAITAVAVVALVSRLFPGSFPGRSLVTYLPSARLSFPLGYWNGLGIFVALAVPLLLRWAQSRRALEAAVGTGAFPLVGAVVYLTSSRGAAAVAAVGLVAAIVLSPARWRAFAGALVAVAGAVVAVAILERRPDLANSLKDGAAVRSQGHSAAGLLLLTCLLTGAVWAFASRAGDRRSAPPPWAGRLVALVAIVVAIAGVALSHPGARLHAFEQPPATASPRSADFTRTHLLSGNGSGRWQFWSAALDEWRSQPLAGHGAGSYEAWWAQHGSFSYFVVNAHSLYLETLGDLGVVGLALLALFLVGGIVTGIRRWRDSRDDVAAALLALVLAWCVGAGLDWIWQLTVVTAVPMLSLGLLAAPATGRAVQSATSVRPPVRSPRFVLGIATIALAWACIILTALPILDRVEIGASQSAVARRDGEAAARAALRAKAIEPWAAGPYLQLALVSERLGSLDTARSWIHEAISRSGHDWRLWLVAARLDTKRGDPKAARTDLLRAAALNPRSTLFRGLSPAG